MRRIGATAPFLLPSFFPAFAQQLVVKTTLDQILGTLFTSGENFVNSPDVAVSWLDIPLVSAGRS
jgi:hypothetical protein